MKAEDGFASAVLEAADACYAVPGYPVTDLAEKCDAEYTVNEKIALEYALGMSLSGKRAVVIVKNAGMNTLADPLVSATYQGLKAGVVIIAGDDTEVRGSQTRQDSRIYGEVASVPVLEPAADELCFSVEAAMQSSETYSRVAIIRVTPAVLDAKISDVSLPKRRNGYGILFPDDLTMRGKCEYAENITAVMKSDMIREKIVPETFASRGHYRTVCRNCPYKPLFSFLKNTLSQNNTAAICDTGCSLLSKNPPFSYSLANYGLGSSPAVALTSTKIALMGDYAVLHSGLNALIDIYEKHRSLFCIILKNRKLGMTGGQDCPDILPYLAPFTPTVVSADDPRLAELIEKGINEKTGLGILVVEGECPSGENHETIEC
ncbi:Indolepyruvate ferredoxin oxidoreductase alpha and beta subunits-like protein [Methanocorpusculum labreanum Z]|uniref:Indolepyruvate ferredoxin oxidoreductase alpha and beta subunits-like protein n=1 Tax=Methanocorpusculum labreanum (strain ATCC 43576 / DSM 4855 / Z) TaxID=410358 RepID=A2SQ01_METLZ|nr:thiamine pyrophosphate-dependent enzyme [Methanocorpusculum labreanum]ABN06407.1 Indolepyruvate ferredoxin oxidoreductase alpha and beta subunits-like protein [Methanocorpusculum labreanum Z]